MVQLAQPTTGELVKRMKMKQEEEEAALAKDCTFQPALLAKKNERVGVLETEGVEDRLYREAAKRTDHLEKAKKEREVKEMEGCSFKPTIREGHNTYKVAAENTKPIYERVSFSS